VQKTRTACARSVDAYTGAEIEVEDVTEPSEEVIEFQLSGDETELSEVNYSLLSTRTAKKVVIKVRDVGKQFVMNNVAGIVGLFTMFQQQPEPKVLQVQTTFIEKSDGATAVQQWSATELTMQHNQLARIATDMNYLVFAFAFLGTVRILEAIVAVFSSNPPAFRRMAQSFYAADYLTIAWLAYNLRKPVVNMLQVDPADLHQVAVLKINLWDELHAFFERQWKLMAMVAVARFLVVTAHHIPPSLWVSTRVKVLWDMMRALPVF
jgi:hypothetical protein